MDSVEILKSTLTNTIARTTKLIQNYEIEIANLTAEIIRLKAQVGEPVPNIVEDSSQE